MELCAGLIGRGGRRGGGGRFRGRQARSMVCGRGGAQGHVTAAATTTTASATAGHRMRATIAQRRHGRRLMMVMMMRVVMVMMVAIAVVAVIDGIYQTASVGAISLSISVQQ